MGAGQCAAPASDSWWFVDQLLESAVIVLAQPPLRGSAKHPYANAGEIGCKRNVHMDISALGSTVWGVHHKKISHPMRTPLFSRRALTITIPAGMFLETPAIAAHQPDISMSNDTNGGTRIFQAAQLDVTQEIAELFYDVDSDVFSCTLVSGPIKSGDAISVMASEDQAWSIRTVPLSIGTNIVNYPVLASVKGSNGSVLILLPAVLKIKVDINASEILHSSDPPGFDIRTSKLIKAGESTPAFFVSGPSILSIEANEGTSNRFDAQPWFAAFQSDDTPGNRGAAFEAWRVERDHVRQ
jgi:hypothetical protein